ncbi:fatty acid-binding protein, intestinal [Petromyzon marinus]|uniref:fatty acid-binding protein, intestinal n=1 Tax=Petromyzon marinus TaxID=7757 RepID=UPI003F70934C
MAFSGTWKVEKNENYEKFLEAMGVNVVKRAAATVDNLCLTITQEGDSFTVKESSLIRSTEFAFSLGVAFDANLADGSDVNGSWTLEGNKLVGKFARKDNGKIITTTREIIDGKLVQTMTFEGVEGKRIFKKQ